MCTDVKLVKWGLSPTSSPEYHINFKLLLAFKFTRNQHLDQHADVDVCVTVPQNLPPDETRRTCEQESSAAISAVLNRSYLPHLSSFKAGITACSVAAMALGAVSIEPICGYKDLNLVLSVELKNQVVYALPELITLYFKDSAAYFALVDNYLVDPETVTTSFCSICLEDFHGGEAALMPCKHVFHGACVTTWQSAAANANANACPICRRPVEMVYHYCPLCRGSVR